MHYLVELMVLLASVLISSYILSREFKDGMRSLWKGVIGSSENILNNLKIMSNTNKIITEMMDIIKKMNEDIIDLDKRLSRLEAEIEEGQRK